MTAESLAEQFRFQGPELFAQLDGEFAFQVRCSSDEFYLVRDPLGLHPLYFSAESPHNFSAYARDVAPTRQELDRDAVASCLRQDSAPAEGYYPAPLQGVFTLAPGHFLHVRNGIWRTERYWSPWRQGQGPHTTQRFRELLMAAVAKRCASRPLAISFSGGLDSSALAACARALNLPAQLISYRWQDFPEADESFYQEAGANHFGFRARTFVADDTYAAANVPMQVRASEMPLADPLFALYQETAHRARVLRAEVLLTGHWGDQVLVPLDALPATHMRAFFGSLEATDRPNYAALWKHWLKAQLTAKPWDVQKAYYQRLLTTRYHVNSLEWNFKLSRRLGIPIRSPFLDKDLIEFLVGAPSDLLFAHGHKSLLREAFKRDLPASILQRRDKADFSAIVAQWTQSQPGFLWEQFDAQALAVWQQQSYS